MQLARIFRPPLREGILIALVLVGLLFDVIDAQTRPFLYVVSVLAVLPTVHAALLDLLKRKVTINVFNVFAIIVSYATGEIRSSGFIALMLSFAELLEWYTASKTSDALSVLLALKPQTAIREREGRTEEIAVDGLRVGDIVVVKNGGYVPVDGVVISGEAKANEASVSGESRLVAKAAGDRLLSSTFVESGALKFRATHVGADSTIERMATLMRAAAKNKSSSEKLADRFAGIFLPMVGLLGLAAYFITHDLRMVASIFLVACADDMAVAIPLAMTASLGRAAKRGVILKGGEWLDVLGKINTLVLDKTGTLTYGTMKFEQALIAAGVDEIHFWEMLAAAERYSEHPIAKIVLEEAKKHLAELPEPEHFAVKRGAGVSIRHHGSEVIVGTKKWAAELGYTMPLTADLPDAVLHVFEGGKYMGTLLATDVPRIEAGNSLDALRALGVADIRMFTGDAPERAEAIAGTLGITSVRARMAPEEKLQAIELLNRQKRIVGMVGDGINDAPSLARANVGIAMGGGGTAVAAEAADVVILTDDLSRLPEMIELGRRTTSVIHSDMVIWAISNIVGFTLVFTGVADPAFAAFFNFATDFFPLINSSRLFGGRSTRVK